MKRAIRVSVVTLFWVPIVLAVGGLARGGADDFAGFEIGSKATSVLFTFNSPSLGVPANPTGEMNLGFSESTLRSGSAYGLGSIAWPGQVAAALPAFLQAEVERQSGEDLPLEIPNYPIRAESFHPQGPPQASLDVGTMHMRSTASEAAAEGVAYLNRFNFPAVGKMGNQSSMSSSGFDPDGAVAMAESSVTDVSLIAGTITLESVVSRATARSDGEKGTLAGKTTITGAEVAGNAVTIDATGVHVADQGLDAVVVQQTVNSVLNQLGISMELSTPVDTIEGPKATRALGGLLIRMKSSTLEPLIAALPAELQTQIRGQLTLDQEVTIQLAPAAVSAGAAKNIEFPVELPDLGGDTPGAVTPVGDGGSDLVPTGSAPTGSAPVAAPPLAVTPVLQTFEGVPVWLVVLLVLAALVSSRPLMALADRIFAARVVGGCPDEGR